MSRRSRRKGKIRITVEARNPDDAKRIAEAIKAAADKGADRKRDGRDQAITPTTDTVEPKSKQAVVGDCEQIETEAHRRAGARLEDNARKAADDNAEAGRLPDARVPASPEEVIEKRGKFIGWLRASGAFAYRCTIKVAADFAKEYTNSDQS